MTNSVTLNNTDGTHSIEVPIFESGRSLDELRENQSHFHIEYISADNYTLEHVISVNGQLMHYGTAYDTAYEMMGMLYTGQCDFRLNNALKIMGYVGVLDEADI